MLTMSFLRYVNIAKTSRRPPPSAGLMQASAGSMPSSSKSSQSLPALSQPSRSTSMSQLPPPMRQQSEDLSSSPYSSLEESNGYGSFPGGTVVYPHTGTTFILPNNIPPILGLNSSGSIHGNTFSSTLDSYSGLPPQQPPIANNYPTTGGYDPLRGGGATGGYESTSRSYVIPRGGGPYDQPRNEPTYESNKRTTMMDGSYSKS